MLDIVGWWDDRLFQRRGQVLDIIFVTEGSGRVCDSHVGMIHKEGVIWVGWKASLTACSKSC